MFSGSILRFDDKLKTITGIACIHVFIVHKI